MRWSGSWAARALWSLGIAVVFVMAWWLSAGSLRSALDHALADLYLPAFAVGLWLSHHRPHQLNAPAYYVALVVETTLLVLGGWSVIVFAIRARRRRRSSRRQGGRAEDADE